MKYWYVKYPMAKRIVSKIKFFIISTQVPKLVVAVRIYEYIFNIITLEARGEQPGGGRLSGIGCLWCDYILEKPQPLLYLAFALIVKSYDALLKVS